MLSGCERYFLELQWDQDCLQLRLSERGALPSREALRRALATAAAGASYPAVTSRSTDGRGSVCLLRRRGRSVAPAAACVDKHPPVDRHNVSALLAGGSLLRSAAARTTRFCHGACALQAGCKRGEGEACSRRIALPLAQADRALRQSLCID